jgi:hypothetical protein
MIRQLECPFGGLSSRCMSLRWRFFMKNSKCGRITNGHSGHCQVLGPSISCLMPFTGGIVTDQHFKIYGDGVQERRIDHGRGLFLLAISRKNLGVCRFGVMAGGRRGWPGTISILPHSYVLMAANCVSTSGYCIVHEARHATPGQNSAWCTNNVPVSGMGSFWLAGADG